MRYVSSITPTTASPNTREVKRVSAAQAVKPVYPPEEALPVIEQLPSSQTAIDAETQQQRRAVPFIDRRKVCRRVAQQPVLEELRSGLERRHNSLREGDMVDHIDVEA